MAFSSAAPQTLLIATSYSHSTIKALH